MSSLSTETRQVIKFDPTSPLGYEKKHAALRGVGRSGDAQNAFEAMLSKMSQSADPDIRGEGNDIVLNFTY
jgi:hypothetical protein